MKKIIMVIISLLLTSNVFAGTTSASQKTTATLTSTCLMSALTLDMGDITQSISGQVGLVVQVGSSSLSILCSKQTVYTIALNLGANTDSVQRLLKDGSGNSISYGICKTTGVDQSKGCASDWYTGNGYNYTVSGIGSGDAQTYPMYGTLRKNYYTPGVYSDTITAIVTY